MIKQIECSGTPYEIGHQHGTAASEEIERCIAFYASLFLKTSKKSWADVQVTSRGFAENIKTKWPRYHEEMRGVADGAKVDLLDIIALNVRTEIAFGLFSDGCTSLYWKTPNDSFLGQNWDWMTTQQQNLIILTITQPGIPTIKMVTEAGIIGKIGLNSHGVGVCFNAIRAPGLSPQNLPAHLGLRMALESTSALEAVVKLEKEGMASSAHILIGDADTAIGLEFTSTTFARLELNEKGQLAHTNHLLGSHPRTNEAAWLKDSPARLVRMDELLAPLQDVDGGEDGFAKLFEDVEGYPGSICRAQEGESEAATLFNIVMELRKRRAKVTVGRPTEKGETVILGFEGDE